MICWCLFCLFCVEAGRFFDDFFIVFSVRSFQADEASASYPSLLCSDRSERSERRFLISKKICFERMSKRSFRYSLSYLLRWLLVYGSAAAVDWTTLSILLVRLRSLESNESVKMSNLSCTSPLSRAFILPSSFNSSCLK